MQNLTEVAAFCKYYVDSILCWFVDYFIFFFPWILFTYIYNGSFAWNRYFRCWYGRQNAFYVFYGSVLENDHIYFRKIAGKYTAFKEKCWKNFCNNPGCTICENEEQLFCKKALLKYFAKFKWKHLFLRLRFYNVAGNWRRFQDLLINVTYLAWQKWLRLDWHRVKENVRNMQIFFQLMLCAEIN